MPLKGVKLKFEGRTVNANVYINIEYGCSIPEIALGGTGKG